MDSILTYAQKYSKVLIEFGDLYKKAGKLYF